MTTAMGEGSRKVSVPLDVFLRQSWPILAFGAALLLIVIGILLWIALSGAGRTQASAPISSPPSTTSTQETLAPRAIDGVLVPPDRTNLLSFAVMIDNHADARPSAGLASANLVIEAPVEGGMTRYLAIYDASTTAELIGPVRSARPYFVAFAEGMGAVYAHVGGSSESLTLITSSTPQFRDLNQYWNGKFFWRSSRRASPHNVYTRMDLLRAAADTKGWEPMLFQHWRYKEDDPLESATGTTRGRRKGLRIPNGGSVDVAWRYDRSTNEYARILNDRPHTETDGASVHAKNIVLLLTEAEVLDGEGRLRMRTTGRGRAFLFRDGKSFELSWRRAPRSTFQFETVDGSDALLNRGTTWIEIVTNPEVFGVAIRE